MDSGTIIRRARRRAGLTQRALAERAGTSHATLSAYESGTKIPRVDTFDRIVQATGAALDIELRVRPDATRPDRETKGRELLAALELAAAFPLRRLPRHLPPPVLRPRAEAT